MAGAVRVPPADFVARLRQWPDFQDLRWNDAVSRWEFVFTSAQGRPVSIFWGWNRNPLTGEPVGIDPVTGLTPFRDLDPGAQAEIIANGEKTYLGNRADQDHTWANRSKRIQAENDAVYRRRRAAQADDFAYALQQVDIRRPGWRKDHQPAPKGHGPKVQVISTIGAKPRLEHASV